MAIPGGEWIMNPSDVLSARYYNPVDGRLLLLIRLELLGELMFIHMLGEIQLIMRTLLV